MTKKEIRNDYVYDLDVIMNVLSNFIDERDNMRYTGSDTLVLTMDREDVEVVGQYVDDYLKRMQSVVELRKRTTFPC